MRPPPTPDARDTLIKRQHAEIARLRDALTRAEHERSLLDLKLTDLFRHVHPEEQKFSWWDYRGGSFHRDLGLRIDLLLGTPAVVSRVRHVEIDREYRKKKEGRTASDHAPVFADLD